MHKWDWSDSNSVKWIKDQTIIKEVIDISVYPQCSTYTFDVLCHTLL